MADRNATDHIDISVVMPCLNEEATIGTCIKKAQEALQRSGLRGEVLVADNGSSDNSVAIALVLGARVVHQPERGYGSAYLKGFAEARGRYFIMGDSDNTYDFSEIGRFLEPLKDGYDFVVGNRFKGKMPPGAMSWSHRHIGNPILSGILNLFFHTSISDAHCGMRAFTKEAYQKMHLQTTGMEFASEMVINAAKARLKITEVPITYYPREGASKLRSFRDAWRHLRFMLLYSPTHLFLVPGLFLMILGAILLLALLGGPVYFAGHVYDIHFSVLGSLLNILGFQVINLGLYAKAYSFKEGFTKDDKLIEGFYRLFKLELGVLAGLSLFLLGFLIDALILLQWIRADLGYILEISKALLATTLMIVGAQIVFSSFLLSLLDIRKTDSRR